MDPRLLQRYNLELQHLREMGAEFAEQFPKIAARLGIDGLEVVDPYVERLLEGFAFLAARVQLKIDAEFPRFTQSLLEIIYPHYLAPTPSMLVAQVHPDPKEAGLATGTRTVPRGSTLRSLLGADDLTACEFRTARDVTLWPIEIASASYFSFAPDLPLNRLPVAQRIRGGLRLRLRTTGGLLFSKVALDRLSLYLTGREDVSTSLYELALGSLVGVLVVPRRDAPGDARFLPPSHVSPVGFSDDEALLPVTPRTFHGYRLLQEYFAFPQRFRFVDVDGLLPAVRQADTSEIEVVLLFGRGDGTLESVVDASNVALHCTPAINLFSRRADRIQVSDAGHEYHVVVDRTRPRDFEVYDVTEVIGHGAGSDSEQRFLPFYAAYASQGQEEVSAYFTTRREMRLPSSSAKRRGGRSSYLGTEVFLSLVDQREAPYSSALRQLSLQVTCTNRDLVLQMPVGVGKTDLTLDSAAPIVAIKVIQGPSRPFAPLADGAIAWRAISHLSLNYLSLTDAPGREGAAAIRDLLELYAPTNDPSARRQIEGVRSLAVKPVVRRLPTPGPLAFGRGLEITVGIEDLAFEGGSAFLLGAVLHRFFARYVTMNAFTETVLRSENRGELNRWVPQWGARPTL